MHSATVYVWVKIYIFSSPVTPYGIIDNSTPECSRLVEAFKSQATDWITLKWKPT